jgi:hypothetical protein
MQTLNMQAFPAVETRNDVLAAGLAQAVAGLTTPLVFKGAVAAWPAVQKARESLDALVGYLKACDNGFPAETFRQPSGADGKYFYGADQKTLNFAKAQIPIGAVLGRLRMPNAEPLYIQSAPLKDHLPKFRAENRLPGVDAEPRAWIGNRSITQIHFDLYYNLACMVAGQKRFVLFPPDQVKNLYMGPIETTVSGVPTSMANLENPDFTAHPRFAEALKTATVAELEPGDVLYIPYMWWHHVSSSGAFNMQVNYWWNTAKPEMGVAMQALLHAMMSLRDLPADQTAAWKAMFDHFVFHQSDPVADHLRPEVRGLMGNIPTAQRATIRKQIGKNLTED